MHVFIFLKTNCVKRHYISPNTFLLQFVNSLGLLDDVEDTNLVQKICAAIDVNSFEVRGPAIPTIGCSELFRGVYLKAALMAHDCVGNTHVAIDDNNVLVCHASIDIKKGDPIFNRYTDPLKVRYFTYSVG